MTPEGYFSHPIPTGTGKADPTHTGGHTRVGYLECELHLVCTRHRKGEWETREVDGRGSLSPYPSRAGQGR